MDRPDWQSEATCMTPLRPNCWAEQSVAPEMVPGPGRQRRVEPPAPKWQNSCSGTAHSLFHGDGTAAQPQGPTGSLSLSPHGRARKEGVCTAVGLQGSATERGRFQARMCPDHPPPALSLWTLPPSQTHLLLQSGPHSSWPSLVFCLSSQVHSPALS